LGEGAKKGTGVLKHNMAEGENNTNDMKSQNKARHINFSHRYPKTQITKYKQT
jgi:hypothetical protein